MVVWGYPCASKSSPAFKSKTPSVTRQRVFFIVRGKGYSTLQAAAEMADQQQIVEYLMNL